MIPENHNPATTPVVDSAPAPAITPEGGVLSCNNEHFATGHLLENLKGRAISNSFASISGQAIQLLFYFSAIAILARLLTPQDFGLVTMVTTITSLLWVFNDAGLSTATIQREGITHAQVSNLFWTNVALGGAISLLLAALAPAIAWFYREPRLVSVTLALCVTFVLTTVAVQHLALIKRQMRFKIIAAIQVSAAAAGMLVGVGMAWFNCGYWSLVGMQLATPLVSLVLAWSFSRWRPQLPARDSGTRSLLHFGAHLTAGNLLWSFARGSDGLLIGRVYGSEALGFYSRAAALLARPVDRIIAPIEAVFIPTLARLQSQPDRYRSVMMRAYGLVAMAAFLFAGLLLPLAHPITVAVLGAKWEKTAPILAAFAMAALYQPIASVSIWLLTSQGRGKDTLLLSSICSAATVLAFVIGLPYGPTGVAVAYSISCLLILLPSHYYVTGRQGPVSTRDLWSWFFTHLPLFFVVCGSTWLTRSLVLTADKWTQLAICTPAGLLAGIVFISLYPPARRSVLDLFQALKEFRNKRTAL